MEPLISIIVPVYNVLPYLCEALDSVLHQTYHHLEIIIVDDGSTDGSGSVCDEYLSDPRVQVIHQENRGLSVARNTGLDRANGQYIVFLDPDDAFRPEMIEQLLKALMQQSADLAVCGYDTYETDSSLGEGEKTESIHFGAKISFSGRDAIHDLAEGNFPVIVWNKLYPKRIWETLRFPEERFYEDIWIMPGILSHCDRIAIVPDALVYHRKRASSITSTFSIHNLQDLIAAHQAALDSMEQIQPPLPPKWILEYRENALRLIIFRWARLSKLVNTSKADLAALKADIQNFGVDPLRFKDRKTKTVWQLFLHCPALLLPAQACFQTATHILGKERGNDA